MRHYCISGEAMMIARSCYCSPTAGMGGRVLGCSGGNAQDSVEGLAARIGGAVLVRVDTPATGKPACSGWACPQRQAHQNGLEADFAEEPPAFRLPLWALLARIAQPFLSTLLHRAKGTLAGREGTSCHCHGKSRSAPGTVHTYLSARSRFCRRRPRSRPAGREKHSPCALARCYRYVTAAQSSILRPSEPFEAGPIART
ncbi:hypothetical protein B0J12DRAFT_680775 [Macrophomina phaseolina]|uniref:Uncharacterized protein n=1 Tax=Macrophomina phaseolina TaxID=35725 RepID=A0ABQ8FX37_9PEZI|nr:hypothetical protein B0J12DRAFT_680775 [Macrophomina phaseolina]